MNAPRSGSGTGDHAEPLVSVIVLTYNHERYIEEALNSVLRQDLIGRCEIIVGNDCSTDGTRAAIDRILRAPSCPVTVLHRPENLGLSRNLSDCWNRCRGRYISLLEGDDYWTDPAKLRRIVERLEQQPELTGGYHRCEIREELKQHDRRAMAIAPEPPATPVTFPLLLRGNLIQTFSAMTYRRGVVPQIPDWHVGLASGDWALHLLHAEAGPIGYLPETLGVYRVHDAGMMVNTRLARRYGEAFRIWDRLDRHFGGRYSDEIWSARDAFLGEIAREVIRLRKIERRYLMLRLDYVAAAVRELRGWFWPKSGPDEREPERASGPNIVQP